MLLIGWQGEQSEAFAASLPPKQLWTGSGLVRLPGLQATLQPPLPLQLLWPLQPMSPVLQPPWPLQLFWPLQSCLADAASDDAAALPELSP